MISKIYKFIRNPRLYFAVLPYKIFGRMFMIKIYRRYWLPHIIQKVRCKRKINIAFLAMNPDMWRYDRVYRKLQHDARFNPFIVTAMRNIPDMSVRIKEQEIMRSFFSARGYSIICGYDTNKKCWVSLKSLRPDIIFYTQPYDGAIESSFEYLRHLNSLHCYSPYGLLINEAKWSWDTNLQQYCWRVFYGCDMHLRMCSKISRIGSCNAVPAGYCFEEEYLEAKNDAASISKAWRNDERKRVIWAPHHSIFEHEMFKVSSFLEIADLMLQLRNEYKSRIVFAFKPHPVLKTKLYRVWGEAKTNEYYADWAHSDASFDAQGDYHALFAGSDAMLHCSGSFIVEYLYTGKPVAYVYSKTRNPPEIGPIGNAALNAHYPMHVEADIRRFLDEVVIGGCDPLARNREGVVAMYLRSPNGKTFSENVYNSIIEGLGI